ncbi:VCBS repeat-containing protein [Paenibacillus sp. IHBB 10380]|uniref:VCBS repeat-containing protein n=1 Tax=Paenibacillus sp. IHBB 10380 TaxID=1566358 RepID=UPI000AC5FD55|nr:VCBS repeat-containing protein [Paenibacillus sp. IHBB 10380]
MMQYMNGMPSYATRSAGGQTLNREHILDSGRGDVTGDGVPDEIWLIGIQQDPSSPFITGIRLLIKDGATSKTYQITPSENAGYNPRLFIGDFTGDRISDILVTIESGGSGATTFNDLYSLAEGKAQLLFNSESYNDYWKYKVDYLNDYRLQLTNTNTQRVYLLDITMRGKAYLDQIYNSDGTLKAPVEGFVDPLSGLYPVDFDRNGVYELMAMQGVSGLYHADRFGYVTNVLAWQSDGWKLQNQWFSIYGTVV